jgi:hypothetical protein
MAETIAHAFSDTWFWVTIVAPLLFPAFGALLLKAIPIPGNPPGRELMSTVKDGQLGWAVVVMGASAVYELIEGMRGNPATPFAAPEGLGIIITMMGGMMLAAGGAVFTTPLRDAAAPDKLPWHTHYQMFIISCPMTLLAAFLYAAIHYETHPETSLPPATTTHM